MVGAIRAMVRMCAASETDSDELSVIADVGRIMADHDINISDFRLGRDNKGQALAVVRVDSDITKELMSELEKLDACISVRSAII